MSKRLKVALAQLNTHVGAIDANADQAIAIIERARDELGCDLLLLPELTLSGYPPEDLLFHVGMRLRIEAALARVREHAHGIAVVLGLPEYHGGQIFNACALLRDGELHGMYRKQVLPNYSVFDEKRYFAAGDTPAVHDINGVAVGLLICEDIWEPGPAARATQAGAQVLVAINGSPFRIGAQTIRERVMRDRVAGTGRPLLYVNMVGGQDELVFDGGSAAVNRAGEVVYRASAYDAGLHVVELADTGPAWDVIATQDPVAPLPELVPSVYGALITGTRDYVRKNGFPGVVIGLSGGIDSALTLAVAVDALGADKAHAVMMPSRYTSKMSLEDAAAQARTLGIEFRELSIEPMFETVLATLAPVFAGLPEDATEENLQARCRGMLLMAISNKTRRMVLTTGNKSETAVGYATLYGDMAGGFSPLKDCSKTLVYRLARYRNTLGEVIPERVIERPPSAELRHGQQDTDSLPPYDVLDPILEAFIEEDLSVDEIAARGFDREVVGRVLGMVRRNEYKRRQGPPGVRVSRRAFGRDWRYPITSGY
jgi:NAD+ synthase (glutamine-hydrolysing)